MIIWEFNAAQKQINIDTKVADIKAELEELQKTAIRKMFDSKLLLDSTAEALIITAKELGFIDLAFEMERDMEI